MMTPSTVTTATSTAVSFQLMVPSTKMLPITASPGGIVFQVNEFSMVHAAFAAAVIRPARAPGKRSTKYRVPWPDRWSNNSSRMSPPTATNACVDTQPASRHNRLSPATNPSNKPTAPHNTREAGSCVPSTSTKCFTAYCDATAQPTAASTATSTMV